MKLRMRTVATFVALLAPLAVQSPAIADPVNDVGVVTGSGEIIPGLPLTGCSYQSSITFAGTAQVVGLDYTGSLDVRFSGASSICESLDAGQGTGTLSGGVSGVVNYSRAGAVVVLSGSVTLNGTTRPIISAWCEFEARPGIPVTSYDLECEVIV